MKNKTIKINLPFIIFIIVLSVLGGVIGELFTRAYIFNDIYSGAFSSELNLNDYNRSNLVIRDAKKVVVNQDVQVKETATQVRESMLNLFEKKAVNTDNKEINSYQLSDFYQLNQPKLSALIVSTDGWALVNTRSLSSQKVLADDFIAINFEKTIYEIDKEIKIADSDLILIHLEEANNLKPISIMPSQDLISGQSLLALDHNKQIISNFLKVNQGEALVKNSDNFDVEIEIYPEIKEIIEEPWLFNFKGQAVAILESEKWIPLSTYTVAIDNALLDSDQEKVSLPSLGLNYINLSQTVSQGISNQEGALIYKNKNGVAVLEGSNADKAGLKLGDIILAVNSLSLNKDLDLSEALLNFKAGEVVDFTIERDQSLEIISVEL